MAQKCASEIQKYSWNQDDPVIRIPMTSGGGGGGNVYSKNIHVWLLLQFELWIYPLRLFFSLTPWHNKLSCVSYVCAGRSGDEHLDSSGLYPVMLHQNTSVFPSTSAGYPPGFLGGASATATSQQSGFPGTSTSQSDPFNPVPGTSQDGADPSGGCLLFHLSLFVQTDQTVSALSMSPCSW